MRRRENLRSASFHDYTIEEVPSQGLNYSALRSSALRATNRLWSTARILHARSLEKPPDDSPPAPPTLALPAKIFLAEQS
jgi:hypothetical protein